MPMLEQAKRMEKFESELDELIDRTHSSGINYWDMLKVFLIACQRLQMQADAEYHAKYRQGKGAK